MNRRDFIKLNGLIAAAPGFAAPNFEPSAGKPLADDFRLEPVDLLGRIRLGQNALLGGLSSRRHLPYWTCSFKNGDLAGFHYSTYQGEGVWDQMHNVGRALHGLSLAESVTGELVSAAIFDDLADQTMDLFRDGDGLPGGKEAMTGRRIVNLHNIRETLNGLTALIKRGYREAEPLARRMVRVIRKSLGDDGRIHLDRLPVKVDGYNHQPSMEGRALDALVRYYRISHDDVALETAALITEFALAHCFSEAGALTWAAGTHGHSINAMVAGMIDFALTTHDDVLLARARRAYDVGLPSFNSSFGWSMESLHKPRLRGEANNTGDLLRATLLLGSAGFPDYFGRAERILRSHLLPSQVVDVKAYSNDSKTAEDHLRNLATRIRGGFSFPTPNDLQFQPDAGIFTYDIVSGVVDALCETYRAIVHEDANGARINLLLSVESERLSIKSLLPERGCMIVTNRSPSNVWMRLPAWVRPADVSVQTNGSGTAPRFVGKYLFLSDAMDPHGSTVNFPIREERTVEHIVYQPFTIDWKGDQIVAMSPPAVNVSRDQAPLPEPCLPMFPVIR
ncbi:MAG: hypothetical protein EXS38_10685 [Opitutus sp.]|nr:hypothetical protein [Opitutus sp.]